LPELNKTLKNANYIANPGCFAAIQLALLPLAANNLLVVMSILMPRQEALAGVSPSETTHFS
jgi:N-acetyl-gamma-glutamylphosphate reductase